MKLGLYADNPDNPDFIAEVDQLRATLQTFAPVLGSYFKALLGEGFERNEAIDLVLAYQAELFAALAKGKVPVENNRYDRNDYQRWFSPSFSALSVAMTTKGRVPSPRSGPSLRSERKAKRK